MSDSLFDGNIYFCYYLIGDNMETRKKIRLENFDYSADGYYFITICTANKQKILGTIVYPLTSQNSFNNQVGACITRPKVELSNYGKIVNAAIKNIPEKYDGVFIDKYVIMPNHVHLIIEIESGRAMHAPTISNIIGQMKSFVTKQSGIHIWQKSFYDHIIRDKNDYLKIWNYIDTNPEKWAEDKYYIN